MAAVTLGIPLSSCRQNETRASSFFTLLRSPSHYIAVALQEVLGSRSTPARVPNKSGKNKFIVNILGAEISMYFLIGQLRTVYTLYLLKRKLALDKPRIFLPPIPYVTASNKLLLMVASLI